mgnify:CR=1 FL=1
MNALLITGGLLNALLAVFHILFWKIFNWKESLKPLDSLQRAIMQVLNIHLLLFMWVVAYISVFESSEMLSTSIGQALMIFVAAFYLIRAANQFIFFDMRKGFSWMIVVYCLALTVLYGWSWSSVI